MIAVTIALLVGGFAVWKNHEQSTKGMVQIAAAGGPFAASIYPVDSSGAGQPPIMTTTVPMQEPIELEQGEYQIRLAASGSHSEFARFGVSASELTHARYVDRRDQADGIPIAKDARLVLVRASDGNDLLAISDESELAFYGRDEQLIFRVNTAQIKPTGNDQEAVDFSHRATGLAGNRDAQDPYYAKQWPLMRRAIDLTGDDKDEFVITAQSTPALAAISQDGEVVWTTQIELPEPSQQPPPMRVNPNRPPPELPSIMEVIPTEDLDGDQISDLVVNLVRIIPVKAVEPFIVSVSGKTGETIAIASLPIQKIGAERRLWPTEGILFHMPIGKDSREYQNVDSVGRQSVRRSTVTWDHQVSGAGTSNLHKLAVTPPLSVTHHDGEPVAVAITDKTVAAWNLKTGKQVGQTVDLPFKIASKPLAVRIGNDQPPAFLVWASVGRNASGPSERPAALVVLGEKKPRWVISTKLRWDIYASGLQRSDLPLASDLDGDGVDELLIAECGKERWAASGTLVCLDASTGEMKWSRRVELESVEAMAERATVLSDFDGDGVREIAVVTLNGRRSDEQFWGNLTEHAEYALYVDLLSGADGRRLVGGAATNCHAQYQEERHRH